MTPGANGGHYVGDRYRIGCEETDFFWWFLKKVEINCEVEQTRV